MTRLTTTFNHVKPLRYTGVLEFLGSMLGAPYDQFARYRKTHRCYIIEQQRWLTPSVEVASGSKPLATFERVLGIWSAFVSVKNVPLL